MLIFQVPYSSCRGGCALHVAPACYSRAAGCRMCAESTSTPPPPPPTWICSTMTASRGGIWTTTICSCCSSSSSMVPRIGDKREWVLHRRWCCATWPPISCWLCHCSASCFRVYFAMAEPVHTSCTAMVVVLPTSIQVKGRCKEWQHDFICVSLNWLRSLMLPSASQSSPHRSGQVRSGRLIRGTDATCRITRTREAVQPESTSCS